MNDSEINSLSDLRSIRTAPLLGELQKKNLLIEVNSYIKNADWFTIGIMAPSSSQAILVLKEMESYFCWPTMKVTSQPNEKGPVFLKANQKTGGIHIRIEFGLGEGVLIGCQYNNDKKDADTIGPLPLNLFKSKGT
tara:strand:- start:681 stop:1088 length:408 start_codon:yes stop_codon:yes gene_type:complete